jgi:hypothetical protein
MKERASFIAFIVHACVVTGLFSVPMISSKRTTSQFSFPHIKSPEKV